MGSCVAAGQQKGKAMIRYLDLGAPTPILCKQQMRLEIKLIMGLAYMVKPP